MRPKKPANERKTEVISLRITAEERDVLQEMADMVQMNVPNLVRSLLVKEIYKV